MTNVVDFVNEALTHRGKPYIFGTEASPLDPDPEAFDCSELVEYSASRTGIKPKVPDGAYYQWQHTRNHGLAIPVKEGIHTYGALLFIGDGTGVGRDAITHVAISLGNGTTIEARGARWGVGVWSAERGFNYAGRIPGLDYKKAGPISPKVPIKLKYAKGDAGKHVDFARFCLNVVKPFRKGKTIKATGPVDDEFLAAVKEFQKACGDFLLYTTGNRGAFHTPTHQMGPITEKALGDWTMVYINKK